MRVVAVTDPEPISEPSVVRTIKAGSPATGSDNGGGGGGGGATLGGLGGKGGNSKGCGGGGGGGGGADTCASSGVTTGTGGKGGSGGGGTASGYDGDPGTSGSSVTNKTSSFKAGPAGGGLINLGAASGLVINNGFLSTLGAQQIDQTGGNGATIIFGELLGNGNVQGHLVQQQGQTSDQWLIWGGAGGGGSGGSGLTLPGIEISQVDSTTIVIQWTAPNGVGTIMESPEIGGPWTPVPGNPNPFTLTVTAAPNALFLRVSSPSPCQ